MRYFDPRLGRERFKRRYVWAFWSYGAGLLAGLALHAALNWPSP